MTRLTPFGLAAQARRSRPAPLVVAWLLAGGMTGALAHPLAPESAPPAPQAASEPLAQDNSADTAPNAGSTSSWSLWAQPPGQTLQRLSTSLRGLWARVQPRVNIVVEPPVATAAVGLGFDRPASLQARLRGIQLFADCGADGSADSSGFRATAGLLRTSNASWWAPSGNQPGSPNLSIQRLYASGVLPSTNLLPADPSARGTRPYLGAGYSGGLSASGAPSLWRFNADVGLMSLNNSSANQVSQLLSGDRSVDDLVRELRFRPNIKVSVGYSF